jgi:hypothetical protein
MIDKTLRYIGLAYLVCYIGAIALSRHGFKRGPMSVGPGGPWNPEWFGNGAHFLGGSCR